MSSQIIYFIPDKKDFKLIGEISLKEHSPGHWKTQQLLYELNAPSAVMRVNGKSFELYVWMNKDMKNYSGIFVKGKLPTSTLRSYLNSNAIFEKTYIYGNDLPDLIDIAVAMEQKIPPVKNIEEDRAERMSSVMEDIMRDAFWGPGEAHKW